MRLLVRGVDELAVNAPDLGVVPVPCNEPVGVGHRVSLHQWQQFVVQALGQDPAGQVRVGQDRRGEFDPLVRRMPLDIRQRLDMCVEPPVGLGDLDLLQRAFVPPSAKAPTVQLRPRLALFPGEIAKGVPRARTRGGQGVEAVGGGQGQ